MAIRKTNVKETTKTEPTYEVLEECGTLSTNNRGWELKLRYIKWNDNEPKYDLRSWKEDENGEKCSKGITLTGEELEALLGILKDMEKEVEV